MRYKNNLQVEEIIQALQELGGEAGWGEIESLIIKRRNGEYEPYGSWEIYRNTMQQLLHRHCPSYTKFAGKAYFERISSTPLRIRLNIKGMGGEALSALEVNDIKKTHHQVESTVRNPREEKSESKRKRGYFYDDIHPIPILTDEKVIENVELAKEGRLEEAFKDDAQKLEIFLLNVYKYYDFIGEIPFGKKSFEYICDLLQTRYTEDNDNKIKEVPPALFVASMVFCARYSEEEARNFWTPYAKLVWKTNLSPYFQKVSREHFVESKLFLEENFDFIFPTRSDGGVVRPVYYQAVIPYYLQSNFAEWLVKRFEQLLKLSTDDLPQVLQKEKSLNYMPSRLRNFVRKSETSDTAAKLIQQMAKAIKLFQTTEQNEAVLSVMNSPIEGALWREIYQKLIEEQSQLEKIRKYTPKLEWVWNLDNNIINLQLSQIRASQEEKPDLIVWAKNGSLNFRNEEILFNIYPWQLPNGDWELEPELFSKMGDLNGKIYVLSDEFDFEKESGEQDNHIIFEKKIPKITAEAMFFFVPANRSVAKEREKIDIDGDWIILSKVRVKVLEQPEAEHIHIPRVLHEEGYRFAKKYSINLPVTLSFQGKETSFQHSQSSFVFRAELFGEKKIKNLSKSVQPIFQTADIKIRANAVFEKYQLSRIWVSVHRGGVFVKSLSLDKLQEKGLFFKSNDGYIISLETFIKGAGAYSVNILHDLKLLLEEDLRFAYLPNIDIREPDSTVCYSPINPPEIIISGVPRDWIKTSVKDKVKISTGENETDISLLWKDVKFPKCRFSLQWKGNNVNFSWDIDRVSAWVEGGGDKGNVLAEKSDGVILNARGKANEEFTWRIRGTKLYRKIKLNAKGEFIEKLNQSALRDLLKKSNLVHSEVEIEMRMKTWDMFAYTKNPSLSFEFIDYEAPYINIAINQPKKLKGNFVIQMRNTEKLTNPVIILETQQLKEKSKFKIELSSGKYRADILLEDEVLATSQEIIVTAPIAKKEILIRTDEEFTAQKLFDSLTADEQELLSIEDEEHAERISILNQLIAINRRDTWVTNEKFDDGLKKLLPSWAVLEYPLRFVEQKHKKIFHIFPQQVSFGAKAGKGYMLAKLEHNPIKIYAAWNSDISTNKTRLWLMLPQKDDIKDFSILDERELWPAYQCVDCGMIVGSKNGNYLKLSPQTIIAHRHEKSRLLREQFLDVVYDMPIEVNIFQHKDEKLKHYYRVKEVLSNNKLFNEKTCPLEGNINIPINTFDNTDYNIAISEVVQNYKKPQFKIPLQQIIAKGKLFKEIKDFVFEKKTEVSAFSAILRLNQEILAKKIRLSRLPKYILLLSLVLRLKTHEPEIYKSLLNENLVSEKEIIGLTYQAMSACPKLMEWSIAWVEIFFNHTIS